MVRNTHEAVVSEDIFEQAQDVLKKYAKKSPPSKPSQRFRGLLKCAVCGRTLRRIICKEPYFSCPTRRTVPDISCRQIHLRERDLEAALLASIQSQASLLLETEREQKNKNFFDMIDREIKNCQKSISRCKAEQTAVFEDYAEGRIARQEYLFRKEDIANQKEEMTARYTELSAKRAELTVNASFIAL